MRSRRRIWDLFSKRFRPLQSRPFCTNNKSNKPTTTNNNNGPNNISKREVDDASEESSLSISRQDAYKELENLNFMTAAKILFTTPPKRKKFGIDFHLVQLFFACMPSLAVYLVAQYARSEMRRMEAELELKKKAEEEAKAKELELKAIEEPEGTSNPQILEVKARLDKLEETVKEIVDVSKKKSTDSGDNSQVDNGERTQPTATKPKTGATDIAYSTTEGSTSKEACDARSTALPDASGNDVKSNQNGRPSPDVKKK